MAPPVSLLQTSKFIVFGLTGSQPQAGSGLKSAGAGSKSNSKGPKAAAPDSVPPGRTGKSPALAIPQMATDTAPQSSDAHRGQRITVGARKVLLEDVVAVAVHGTSIELDPPTLQKCGEPGGSKQSTNGSAETPRGEDVRPEAAVQEEAARAAIFALIVSLMQGRSGVGGTVIAYLTDMLNQGITPLLPMEAIGEGAAVLNALGGGGKCYAAGSVKPLKQALEAAGISPCRPLSAAERDTIALKSHLALGRACVAAVAAGAAVELADAVAALTCEAAGAHTEPFESVHFDICRQHRGQTTSAEHLRLLLEGSRMVTAGKAGKRDPQALRCIPQYHGPAREAAAAAHKALEVELNSVEAGPLTPGGDTLGPFHPQQIYAAADAVKQAVSVLLGGSRRRSDVLRQGPSAGTVEAENLEDFAAAPGPDSMEEGLQELQSALGSELGLSLGHLQAEEDKQDKQQGKDKDEADGPKGGREPEDGPVDTKGLSAAQIAKVEAKRKAKAEKAAAKAAAKAAKKGRSGIVLGTGTTDFRTRLLTATGGSTDPNQLAAQLDFWALGEESPAAFVGGLLERLSRGGVQRKPKIAKGTRDFGPDQMRVREQAFTIIRRVFKRHGAVEIDTPVFELKETLTGKYGEDQKLIYDLADQGGELLALRYDLTVPFARYLALNNVGNIKRFHIAKVYRRDQPNLQRGRFREFYQCDFDVAGNYGPMVPDAEVLSVACEILSELPIGGFEIKLNHRRLLDAILDICGCPGEKFRAICSAIDKLDKAPWSEVRCEMVEEKGLKPEVADRIGEFVTYHGAPRELWQRLTNQKVFGDHKDAAAAMGELDLLFSYMEAMGTLKYISFDLSLARGLAYYTGVIYECVVLDGETKVGSIAAGGRYDNLVGMFTPGGQQTPCVGVSIGIERVFAIMEQRALKLGSLSRANVQVFVATVGPGLLVHRMQLARLLWDSNLSAEFSTHDNPTLKKQLTEVLERGIPFMVILGEEEIQGGVVKVKDVVKRTEEVVPRDQVLAVLLNKGCRTVSDEPSLLQPDPTETERPPNAMATDA